MAKTVSPGVQALRKVVEDVYADARKAKAEGKLVGWSSSKFPCELAEAFDLNVMYPENQAAGIAANRDGEIMCQAAEDLGFDNDICGYARISLAYAAVSLRFRYYGEMITYLGMTLPMAVWSTVTWLKNPSKENGSEVAIQTLARSHLAALAASTVAVAAVFYYILKLLDTPNLFFSTVSIITSFLAAALTMLRSSYYAVGYAANDVVLIVLWVMASMENPAYIPVAVNFAIFLLNDLYGFVSWKKREVLQTA